ncbi:MAG: asparaginase [Bacillota bacterium]|nr:asparaginase [Bacillota bacterium]
MFAKKMRVAVFTTGGTIASSFDARTNTIIPSLQGDDLLKSVSDKDSSLVVELHEFCNVPSPHLTPEIGFMLAKEISAVLTRDDIEGAVVVQGTDTLEEIAYLVDLLVDNPKPVVFTGAMKSQDELYADGLGNLNGAIRVASQSSARNRGVLIYFNQEIHSAERVVKCNANNIASFRSPGYGPVGMVYGEKVVFMTPQILEQKLNVDRIDPRIVLLKASCGMDPFLLESCINTDVSGIVIEGLGAGNLPPLMCAPLEKALVKNVPVVMVSRCHEGMAMNLYAYEGGGAQLYNMGVILGGMLNGPKARIKLMVALGHTRDISIIRCYFENRPDPLAYT